MSVNKITKYIQYHLFNLIYRFSEVQLCIIQTKFNKHFVYSLINRVEASGHLCALAQIVLATHALIHFLGESKFQGFCND